jgi:hypothetical protein
MAVLTLIAVGFAFGYAPLGSYLADGVLLAVFLANSGVAWDNAKKLVEDGHHSGKGSEAHAATVISDPQATSRNRRTDEVRLGSQSGSHRRPTQGDSERTKAFDTQ